MHLKRRTNRAATSKASSQSMHDIDTSGKQTHKHRVMFFFVLLCAAMLLLSLFSARKMETSQKQQQQERERRRPNLIFIMTDQQRYDALSLAAGDRPSILKTPHMDRIGREGAFFRRAFSQCPVCGPARTSLLTGQTIEHTHVDSNRNAKSPNVTTAKTYDDYLVTREGYVAEYYGKWHAPPTLCTNYANRVVTQKINGPFAAYLVAQNLTRPRPEDMANGTQIQSFNGAPYRTNPLDSRHGMPPGSEVNMNGGKVIEPHQHGVSLLPAQHTLTAFDARRALEALERLARRNQDDRPTPFSLHVSFFNPHAPITPSEPFASMFDPAKVNLPVSLHDPMVDSPYQKANGRMEHPEYRNESLIGYMMTNYYAYIKEIDVWVGNLLDALDRLDLTDHTLVVFTSDHGEHLGSHGMIEKNTFYEESVHVPLLLRFPGVIPAGTVVDTPVSHVDVFSTILDYLGATPQPSDGQSLRPLVQYSHGGSGGTSTRSDDDDGTATTKPPPHRGYAVSEWNTRARIPGLMIRTTRWKLMMPTTIESDVLNVLYDLEHDPWEMRNLLFHENDRRRHLPVAEELRHELVGWLRARNSALLDPVMNRPL